MLYENMTPCMHPHEREDMTVARRIREEPYQNSKMIATQKLPKLTVCIRILVTIDLAVRT